MIPIYGWRDLSKTLESAAAGTGIPALAAFGLTGTVKQKAFAVGDSVYIGLQVPHDIRVGSTMYPYVQWTTNGVIANTVKWQMNYTTAKSHDQEVFPADTILTLEQAAQGTAWRHMLIEDAVGFSALEPDEFLAIELVRITNGGVDNADTVFGLSMGLHYQVQQFATPNRTPNFYT